MVTERQRDAQAALFNRVVEMQAAEGAPAAEAVDWAEERRRVLERLRERWASVRQLGELG